MSIFETVPVWARRLPVLLCAALSLLAGLAGGYVRFGGTLLLPEHWVIWHGALLAGLFFPTLIALERAVATQRKGVWLSVALMCAADLLAVIKGDVTGALSLALLAALILSAAHAHLAWKHKGLHLWIMALATLLLASGHFQALRAESPVYGLAGWGGFLVLTIMAERIELSRVRRPDFRSQLIMGACSLFMAAGLFTGGRDSGSQMTVVLGAAGALLWLWRWDLARMTWRRPGLPGYTGINVLTSYFWLTIALISLPYSRDLSIHAVMLGYVLTMVMAHAPIVFPAILRRRLRFTRAFYLPSGLLQISLVMRMVADLSSPAWQQPSALLSMTAIVLLFVTTLWHLGPQPVAPLTD